MNFEDAVNHNFGGFTDKDNNNKFAPLVDQATEKLMKKYKFITIEETDEILYYQDGVYVKGGKKLIAKTAQKLFSRKLHNHHLSEIWGQISRETYVKHEELDADINVINLKNGLYYIKENILKPHTPKYYSINQKAIVYNKDAKPKLFIDFLRQVLYPRNIRTGIEAMAYTFHRDYTIETVFILQGFGLNGKSVFTTFLTILHSATNTSNVSLSEMLSDKFALSDLENKDVNIDTELAGTKIKETATLKKLTGGSKQRIRIQRKGQQAYDTILYAKLFFNANRVPDAEDISDAYNRRLTFISFPNRFEGKNDDKHLILKLTTEEEISGVFNMLMNALRRILRTGELYVNGSTLEEKRLDYERRVHTIKSFLNEVVAEDSTESNRTIKEEVYEAYEKYCKKYILPVQRYDPFCKVLKHDFGYQDTKILVEKKQYRCWLGIVLIPEYARKTEQTTLSLT